MKIFKNHDIEAIIGGLIAICVMLEIAYIYLEYKQYGLIFVECHKLQKYTPETEQQYLDCMIDHGLNPTHWE
jgi:hypothetical protein